MKRLILVVLAGFLVFSGVGQAKTVIMLPGEVCILPDLPNGQYSVMWYPRTGAWDTALTTELIRWKFLYGMAGWTINEQKWVLGAGVDITQLVESSREAGVYTMSVVDVPPLTYNIRFYCTYGFDIDLQKRVWMAAVGCDLFNFRNKK